MRGGRSGEGVGNGVEVGHGAGKEETQESCGERLKGQKLHLGSAWLASHMPDGKPIWEGHTCEGDCVLRGPATGRSTGVGVRNSTWSPLRSTL